MPHPPAMEKVLSLPAAATLLSRFGREQVKRTLRSLVAEAKDFTPEALLAQAAGQLDEDLLPEARRVINATGVLIHTNLGRAPLSAAARLAIADAAEGYHALEFDLETGRRGSRGGKTHRLLAQLLGVEDTLIVNNNAAAILLALAATASGREVLVSRGELVAIGGSFKIPEVLEISGAKLREAGTTNRTKIDDYEKHFTRNVAALLTVHPSNYEIRGYVKKPAFAEIAVFCRKKRIPWIHDLGSGNLADLSTLGITGEERAGEALAAGASLICFSGDKLFGGPQGGVLAGRKALVQKCRLHPLGRAVRADKLTLAGFFATLSEWLADNHAGLPIYTLARTPREELKSRAEKVAAALPSDLRGIVAGTESLFGGGTTPEKTFPSVGLALSSKTLSAAQLATRLRHCRPPVIGRTEGNQVVLDFRTIFPEEDESLTLALKNIFDSGD